MSKVVLTDQLAVTVNGTALTTYVAAFTVNVEAAEADSTAFGNTWRQRMTGGLKDGSVTISFHNGYASGEPSAVINPLLGSYATVVASGTLGGTAVAGTAVCYVGSVNAIGGAVGDLMTSDVTWATTGSVTGWGL